MNTASLNSLWSYLQSLSLTANNKKWLANHLNEAAREETKQLTGEFSLAQLETLEKARALSEEQVDVMEQQEFLSPEELKLVLYRTVDNVYSQA